MKDLTYRKFKEYEINYIENKMRAMGMKEPAFIHTFQFDKL